MDLPDIVKEINKKAGSTKIAPLSEAKSFAIKRYFSGSFGVDYTTGGGFTYKRILLLYGHKSSGKNSHLYQMLGYNQRLCRTCHGILPEYYEATIMDRWTFCLKYYFNKPVCSCSAPKPKVFWLLDYEKSLGVEDPKPVVVRKITVKDTGDLVDENFYNEKYRALQVLKTKEKLEEEEKIAIENIEKYISTLDIQEEEIQRVKETDYMKACGVIIDNLLVSDPKHTDEGIDLVKKVIKSREIDGVIWDSIQAAIPKYVEQRDADQATMGQEAKLNGLLMRQIVSAFASEDLLDETEAYKPTVFITSQVRENLGDMHASVASFSGGHALAHHISLALEFKRDMFLDQFGKQAKWGDPYYGQRVRIRAEKNKLNAPGDHIYYNYYFRVTPEFPMGTIDHISELMELGILLGSIRQGGAWYYVKDKKFNGKPQLREYLGMDSEFVAEVYLDLAKRF